MSVQSENKDAAFQNWKLDLEAKCEEHLLLNPEETPTSIATAQKVRCFESIYAPGAWNVYIGSERITTFTGSGAHEKALEMVKELAKKN
jgi:hypothetical protein